MFPACALLEAMKQRGHSVTLITDARGKAFCENISPNIVLDTIRFSFKNILSAGYHAFLTAAKFFRMWIQEHPDVIIGFGGVFTVIPILVAKIFGSKIVIYEQNSILGKANKFLERFADLKVSSFRLDESWTIVSPIVRDEFIKDPVRGYECDGNIKILIIGGSQGAASFSRIVPQALSQLTPEERKSMEIIQQANDYEELKVIYKEMGVKATLERFLYYVAEIMLTSQLVICRSGASTLSELSATGRPAILIPYPDAMDNHQFYNALHYQNKKAAWVLEEKDGIEKELSEILRQILKNRELLKKASSHIMDHTIRNAANCFVDLVEQNC
jgi:UDP-N-acetylglucosamine--N-acetylmuramyl-(pentapeptide) pyrophosphoryl-undecaprenol N-acetylglucosamine transferase